MSGFKNFILRGNLVDLAVAVVIGAQFSSLVKQFVQSFISPLLALIGGKPNFNTMVFTFHGSRFTYGTFLTEVLSFAISAAVVYFVVVVPVSRALKLFDRDQAATERNCPECTMSIPVAARRCPECSRSRLPGSRAQCLPGSGRRHVHGQEGLTGRPADLQVRSLAWA
jgi:large conductance mechanosensitive channel